jgi:hypothetical protein
VIAVVVFDHFYSINGFTRKNSLALEDVGDEGVSFRDGKPPFDVGSQFTSM